MTYALVGPEYYDTRLHPTCADLGEISRQALQSVFVCPEGGRILEVGAGNPILPELMDMCGHDHPSGSLMASDRHLEMLSLSSLQNSANPIRYLIADARHLPFSDNSLACIVSSLFDPYNDKNFGIEIERCLEPGGEAFLTTPSFDWASQYRAENAFDSATFTLRDGREIDLPSSILPIGQQQSEFQKCGLIVQAIALHYAVEEPRSPKLSDVFAKGLPIVYSYRLEKPHTSGSHG